MSKRKRVDKKSNFQVRKVSLSKLKFSSYNPRRISKDNFKALRNSIEKFGCVSPIIWNERTGNVVGGHQRLKVLTEIGVKDVQVVVVDLDEHDEKMLNVALNNEALMGEWDAMKLRLILDDLKLETLPDELAELKFDSLESLFGPSKSSYRDEEKDNAASVQMEYKILIECRNEGEQRELLEKFEKEGIVCRALIV